MADPRPETRTFLSSDAIDRINFRTGLRGYDTHQVREYLRSLAEHVRGLQSEIDSLTIRLREAERAAANPVMDEATLAGALGDETARILKSAHEAAADIRGRAEEHVERVTQQAREDGARLTNEAANILDVRRTAAEAEAAEILRAANDEARRVTEESTAKAAAVLTEAQELALTTVEGAKAERAEVLSDVRRRRRVANTQIEQLRAGRERLLQAYDVVRSTLEQVTTELDVADVEAKAAAEEVGRRMNAAIDPLRADALASTPLVDLPPAVEAPRGEAPRGEASRVEAPRGEAPPSRPHRKKGKGARPPIAVIEPEPSAASSPDKERLESAPAAPSEPEVVAVQEPEPVASEPEPEPEPEPQVEADVTPEPVVATEPEPEPMPEPQPILSIVEDTRAGAQVAARAETCGALEDHLTRRVKRALQDEQNLVLDRLRSVRGTLNADSALGAESDHVSTYVSIVEPALADAARAGSSSSGNVVDVPASMIATVARDFADELVLPLRRQLDERLHESAAVGDDRITASDRVSAAYREAKTQRAGRLASDWLTTAWAVGVYAATAAEAPGEWLADPAKPCCTDCADNGLAGGVAKGTAFPTGHLHPPAHPGCRCVIVPSTL